MAKHEEAGGEARVVAGHRQAKLLSCQADAAPGARRARHAAAALVAGMGGCPYAPGATGNVATEDLGWLFAAEGYDTGIDLAALARAAHEAGRLVGRRLRGAGMRRDEEGSWDGD